MKNRIGIVLRKEAMDNLRDKRTLATSLMSVLIGPVMALLLIMILGQLIRDKDDKPLNLPIQGVEHAQTFVDFLKQHQVVVQPVPADPKGAVRSGEVDAVLVILPTFAEEFSQGKPAPVQLMMDTSRTSARPTVERVRKLLAGYSGQTANLRLLARGVNPETTAVLTVETIDISTPQSKAMLFLLSLPTFLILTIFVGGMAVIIDTTAGERERGSLEPLLINPVKRWELVLGKLGASLCFTFVSIALTLCGFAAIFNIVPVDRILDIPVSVKWMTFGKIFVVALPLALFAASLQMLVVSFAKSYKEAQNMLAWLPIVPLLPGMALSYMTFKSSLWIMFIPTISQQYLVLQYLRGESVNWFDPLLAGLVTVAGAAILLGLTIRLYSREQILYVKQ